ncbi:HAMP domain-containing protein, partial [Photobacterium sanctipauli]
LESWVVGPILQLNRAMRITVNNHNTTKRLDVQSSDEIGSLVKCFNEMMGSLEARDSYIQKTLEQLANEVTFADDVISTINHGLVVLSRDGKVKMANSTYYSLFPNSKDQMIGQSFNKSTCDEIWNTCESWLSKMHNETKFEAIIESVKYHNSERFYFITGCRL